MRKATALLVSALMSVAILFGAASPAHAVCPTEGEVTSCTPCVVSSQEPVRQLGEYSAIAQRLGENCIQ